MGPRLCNMHDVFSPIEKVAWARNPFARHNFPSVLHTWTEGPGAWAKFWKLDLKKFKSRAKAICMMFFSPPQKLTPFDISKGKLLTKFLQKLENIGNAWEIPWRHGKSQICMGNPEKAWEFWRRHGNSWESIGNPGKAWEIPGKHGKSRKSMGNSGKAWKIPGKHRKSREILGKHRKSQEKLWNPGKCC